MYTVLSLTEYFEFRRLLYESLFTVKLVQEKINHNKPNGLTVGPMNNADDIVNV